MCLCCPLGVKFQRVHSIRPILYNNVSLYMTWFYTSCGFKIKSEIKFHVDVILMSYWGLNLELSIYNKCQHIYYPQGTFKPQCSQGHNDHIRHKRVYHPNVTIKIHKIISFSQFFFTCSSIGGFTRVFKFIYL